MTAKLRNKPVEIVPIEILDGDFAAAFDPRLDFYLGREEASQDIRSILERLVFFGVLFGGFLGEVSLVWRGDDRLCTYYRHINPRVSISYGTGVADRAAYRDGLEESQKVQICRLVGSNDGFGGYIYGT